MMNVFEQLGFKYDVMAQGYKKDIGDGITLSVYNMSGKWEVSATAWLTCKTELIANLFQQKYQYT
jgi:hypothetical protein